MVAYPASSARNACRVTTASPGLSLFYSGCAHSTPFDALKKRPRQLAFSRMVLAVHRAQVEKLIAQGIALFLLREDALQRQCEFAQTGRFRPGLRALLANRLREKAAPAARALVQASQQLLAEGAAQRVELAGLHLIARVHTDDLLFRPNLVAPLHFAPISC